MRCVGAWTCTRSRSAATSSEAADAPSGGRGLTGEVEHDLGGALSTATGEQTLAEFDGTGAHLRRSAFSAAARIASALGVRPRSTTPAPRISTRSALRGWSAVCGKNTIGTPWTSDSQVEFMPPCVMKSCVRASTGSCGTQLRTIALAGSSPSSAGSVRLPIESSTGPG